MACWRDWSCRSLRKRSGSTPAAQARPAATYAGDLEILGANNALLLDGIAWYGGNCGVDYELAEGIDISSWPEKQYDLRRAERIRWVARPRTRGACTTCWGTCGNGAWMNIDYGDASSEPRQRLPAGSSGAVRGASARGTCAPRTGTRVDPGNRDLNLGFRCGEFQAGYLSEG